MENSKLAKSLSCEADDTCQPQSMDEVHRAVGTAKAKMHSLLDALLSAGIKPGLYDDEGKRYDGTPEPDDNKPEPANEKDAE